MRTASLVLLILLLSIDAAAAIECRATLPSDRKEHWAWRMIDGRQCWYQGPTGLDKSLLHWPAAAPPPAAEPPATEAMAPIAKPPAPEPLPADEPMADESERLAASVWPPYDQEFADRWPDKALPHVTYVPLQKAAQFSGWKLLRDIVIVGVLCFGAAIIATIFIVFAKSRTTPPARVGDHKRWQQERVTR